MTAANQPTYAYAPPDRARGWHGWQLDPEHRVLTLERDGVFLYEVDLERAVTPAQALDWVAQVAGKTWATDEVLAGFVRALDDTVDLQATLCPFGRSRRLTLAELDRRIAHRIELGR